jgi:hypothetical protein
VRLVVVFFHTLRQFCFSIFRGNRGTERAIESFQAEGGRFRTKLIHFVSVRAAVGKGNPVSFICRHMHEQEVHVGKGNPVSFICRHMHEQEVE